MNVFLRRMLAVLTVLGALVLVLAAAGLIPPEEPAPVRVERFRVEQAIVPTSKVLLKDHDPGPASSARALRFVPLCEAPALGVRWFKLALFAQQEALLVFCKQGYELFAVGERAGDLSLTRVARFKAHGDLPGGAAAGDFDGDGQRDLVLGVAARPGVVHRSGAGVFWLRGRAQGGFESARILAEISSSAIGAYAPGAGRPDQLFVLTAGDVAAQRPAELWLFAREPSLSRKQVLPVGLDPRGLALRGAPQAEHVEAFVLTGQPGRLSRATFNLGTLAPVGQPAHVELRGAQAFAHDPSFGDGLFLRDATALYVVERAALLRLVPFAREAHVGPFVLGDLNGDLKPDAFAAIEAGVAWLSAVELEAGAGTREVKNELEELALPEDLKVLDVESLRVSVSALTPVALISGRPDVNMLSLVILPAPPWKTTIMPALLAAELEPGQSPAEVALE
jgi:hypothetical protein